MLRSNILIAGIALASIVMAGCVASSEQQGSSISPAQQNTTEALERAEASKEETISGPKANAIRSAKQYLSFSGFSRDGLINQLSSDAGDGYAIDDATFAVDSLNNDWDNEAVRSAKQYLSFSGFSCDGLIEQLSSSAGDKYTLSQATFGAKQAGACG